MKAGLYFPAGALLQMKVESKGAWSNLPTTGGSAAETSRTDEWEARCDGERYGRELRRTSPDGTGRWRTVIWDRQVSVFSYDLDAPQDAPVIGKLYVRAPTGRGGMRWRMPLVDYLDRAFATPSRFGDLNPPMHLVNEDVNIDGHRCREIQGAWNDRQVTYWLDEESDWLPRKYTMHLEFAMQDFEPPDSLPGGAIPHLKAPDGANFAVDRPLTADEILSDIVLEKIGSQTYITRATLHRTLTFDGGVTYNETLTFDVHDLRYDNSLNNSPFFTFADVMRDGTPMEEHFGGRRFDPEIVNYYIWKKGQFVPSGGPDEPYWARLWHDLKRLSVDFSLENLRRLDTTFLMVVCALAALAINGAMVYNNYRKKKPEMSPGTLEPEQSQQ